MLLGCKKIFEQKKSKDNLLITYNQLVDTYSGLKMPDSATFYFNQYKILNNELFEEMMVKQTTDLEAKYQTAKKEKLLLEKEAENKKKTTWLIGISVLTLFIGAIGFLIYRQQKLKNKQQEQEWLYHCRVQNGHQRISSIKLVFVQEVLYLHSQKLTMRVQ